MGEFAERNGAGEGATDLVAGFFGALQAYDYRLFESVRFDRPVAADAPELLDATVAAMDRCSALRGARFTRPLIGYPINFADCLIGSPITSHSTGGAAQARWASLPSERRAHNFGLPRPVGLGTVPNLSGSRSRNDK